MLFVFLWVAGAIKTRAEFGFAQRTRLPEAMALPWVIYQLQHDGKPINQNVAGINEGVVWMCGTLVLVIAFVLMPPFCKLSYAYGPILVSVYLAYLVLTSGETFGWWPPLVK